jgi:hypothetical protein
VHDLAVVILRLPCLVEAREEEDGKVIRAGARERLDRGDTVRTRSRSGCAAYDGGTDRFSVIALEFLPKMSLAEASVKLASPLMGRYSCVSSSSSARAFFAFALVQPAIAAIVQQRWRTLLTTGRTQGFPLLSR